MILCKMLVASYKIFLRKG